MSLSFFIYKANCYFPLCVIVQWLLYPSSGEYQRFAVELYWTEGTRQATRWGFALAEAYNALEQHDTLLVTRQ